MFIIECIHKLDSDENFQIKIQKNFIYFGSSSDSEIIIPKGYAKKNHLLLEVNEIGCYLHPGENTCSFLHNNNKTTKIKKTFKGDSFEIGPFYFTILDIELTKKLSVRELINEQTEKVLNNPILKDRIQEVHERI